MKDPTQDTVVPDPTDQELLRSFVERRDEQAFTRIVERYLNVVYAAARRQVGVAAGSNLADDVTQAVFIVLAKKAASIRDGRMLAGWLIQTARLAAKAAQRSEMRRKDRERRVAEMTDTQQDNLSDPLAGFDENLDSALSRLNDADRTAITLRFLQDKPIREVAELMGTSEDAATKRISRAVAKLRGLLSAGSVTRVASGAMTDALLRQAHISAPPQLSAQSTAQASLHGTASASVATIATAALGGALWKMLAGIAAAILLVVAVGVGAFVAVRAVQTPTARAAYIPTPASSNSRLKVGVYISLNTATRKNENAARGWEQFRIMKELNFAPDIDPWPLIEPGSEKNPVLAHQLQLAFPGKTPIDVTDVSAIEKMDVLLAASAHYATVEAMNALETAVRNGTPLVVRQCLGGDDDGYARPVVRHLRLFDQADVHSLNATGRANASILGSHPLLGGVSGRLSMIIPVQPYGGYGSLADGATPLLEVKDTEHVHYDGFTAPLEHKDGFGVYPLVVGTLGKGRLVSCAFPAGKVPVELENATKGHFGNRLIRWAAGRDALDGPS